MRIGFLVLSLALAGPAAAQLSGWGITNALEGAGGQVGHPIGQKADLTDLERLAMGGDRRASALLAVLLQDSQVEADGIKSAIHFQVAIAAGCSDLDALAARAVDRLSPSERATYEAALPHWAPVPPIEVHTALKARCLSW